MVKHLAHGVESESEFHHEFFASTEYRSLVELGETINTLIEEDGYFQRGEKTMQTRDFAEGLNWLMNEARRGYTIQRYKGLGEMNPEQLHETTLDENQRTLLQVRIGHVDTADEMFSKLMGDVVEPRREFIQTNALSVANLDV